VPEGKQLSDLEIEKLIAYHYNTMSLLQPRSASAFSKEQTIMILNAVTDKKTTTEDGAWKIKYRDGHKKFFVKPASGHFVPCGDFVTENALARLEL
jgi:hypothetical protein